MRIMGVCIALAFLVSLSILVADCQDAKKLVRGERKARDAAQLRWMVENCTAAEFDETENSWSRIITYECEDGIRRKLRKER